MDVVFTKPCNKVQRSAGDRPRVDIFLGFISIVSHFDASQLPPIKLFVP